MIELKEPKMDPKAITRFYNDIEKIEILSQTLKDHIKALDNKFAGERRVNGSWTEMQYITNKSNKRLKQVDQLEQQFRDLIKKIKREL